MTTETKRDSLQRPKGRGFSHASIMKNEELYKKSTVDAQFPIINSEES